MSRTRNPGRVVEWKTLWPGNLAATGERFGFNRHRGNRLSAAQPVEGDEAGAERVGGIGFRPPAEILRAHGGGKKACPGDGRELGEVFDEHEQVADSARAREVGKMADAEQKIDLYLVKLRRLLRAMNREDAGDVVRELR